MAVRSSASDLVSGTRSTDTGSRLKHAAQLDTRAGRYAVRSLRDAYPTLMVIEGLELNYGLTPKDAEALVELAEESIAQEKDPRE